MKNVLQCVLQYVLQCVLQYVLEYVLQIFAIPERRAWQCGLRFVLQCVLQNMLYTFAIPAQVCQKNPTSLSKEPHVSINQKSRILNQYNNIIHVYSRHRVCGCLCNDRAGGCMDFLLTLCGRVQLLTKILVKHEVLEMNFWLIMKMDFWHMCVF